jgi:bifunctional non-homologous end joining protein LigD
MGRTSLDTYRKKRDFKSTPEPSGKMGAGRGGRFVVHEHHASHLHFDLRLEMAGVLKSWAVPKGPSLDPKDRRLAVETEDHPIQYLSFQGSIGDGQYGAGQMVIWDTGTYTLPPGEDPLRSWENGKLHIDFRGGKLKGVFILVRSARGGRQWLFFKRRDEDADVDWQPSLILPYGSRKEKPAGFEIPAKAPGKGVTVRKKNPRAKTASGSELEKTIESWPEGAKPKAMPKFIEPMLATLADKAFDDPDWIFETKWDGWRAFLRMDPKGMTLISRSGKSLDAMFPELMSLHESIGAASCMIDGEIVALDGKGVPRFQLLQSRLKGKLRFDGGGRIVFYAFDIPFCGGMDLTACPLIARKALLREILPETGPIRYSEHFEKRGREVFEEAVRLGFEGALAKLKDGPYRPGRSADWLKFKSKLRQEVVIGGYTEPRGARARFGSLVSGLYRGDELVFTGHVGGGFDAKLLSEVHGFMTPLETKVCPFAEVPKTNEKVRWVRPKLVAEVEFAEWTEDGRMRQPIFMGLRPDKDARDCVRDDARPASQLREEAEAAREQDAAGDPVRARETRVLPKARPPEFDVTHPDKVLWPAEGYTKADLIGYYRAVSPYLLPHLKDRPLILKRYPGGIDKPPFFQHDLKDAPAFVKILPLKEGDEGTVHYALCQNLETLVYLANLGVIPQNPWLSRTPHLHRPDWIVFDLDPQEVAFPEVCDMARYLNGVLESLGLKAFPKTSGSRGIHIFLPLKPVYDFDQALDFALLVANYAVREKPDAFTVERSLKVRKRDRIYLDCMQNSYGKSVASVYSARERPGACVSAPLEWPELKRRIRMEDFDIRSMPKRLERKGDLFQNVLRTGNSLEAALKKLEKRM